MNDFLLSSSQSLTFSITAAHVWTTAEVWREIWADIGPMLATAMGGIEGTYVEEQLLFTERNGYPEETYYTFSYSPISEDDGNRASALKRTALSQCRTVEVRCAASMVLPPSSQLLPWSTTMVADPKHKYAVEDKDCRALSA